MTIGKWGRFSSKLWTAGATMAVLSLAASPARAAVYSYVDWTSANVAGGTAAGTITLPDSSTVTVTFEAINANLTPGTLYGAQTNGAGVNYWTPTDPYISTQVENAPPPTDILQLSGGLNQTYKVTLSEPIKDPIMALVSLGAPATRCTYDFDSPFTIVSVGTGYWGGNATSLKALPDDILEGYEGHGTIQFIGTFTTFSWTVPTPESWHGFTFGIRTTERIEPTPSEGGAGGGGSGGSEAFAGSGSEGGTGPTTNEGGAPNGAAGANGGEAGGPLDGLDGGSGEAGATTGGGSTNGGSTNGGSPGLSEAGASGADAGDRSATKQDAGCGCAVAGDGDSLGGSAALRLGLAWLARKRRSRI